MKHEMFRESYNEYVQWLLHLCVQNIMGQSVLAFMDDKVQNLNAEQPLSVLDATLSKFRLSGIRYGRFVLISFFLWLGERIILNLVMIKKRSPLRFV